MGCNETSPQDYLALRFWVDGILPLFVQCFGVFILSQFQF